MKLFHDTFMIVWFAGVFHRNSINEMSADNETPPFFSIDQSYKSLCGVCTESRWIMLCYFSLAAGPVFSRRVLPLLRQPFQVVQFILR